MEAMGGRLFFLWDELDTANDDPESNTEQRLHELAARAEREARRTSQRYKLAARHRARKGLHQPSPNRPFGHTDDLSKLVPHEAELIHEAARRVVAGEPLFRICRDWTARGIPTTTGVTLWRNDKLHYILTSARLVGKREYDDAVIDLPHVPAILDEQLWQRVRDKLTPNGSLLITVGCRGGAAGLRQHLQAAVVAAGAGALATTTASSVAARSRGSAKPAPPVRPPARSS